MNFNHRFGSFHENVTVDGKIYTFDEYKTLPKEGRTNLVEEAVARCVEANRRHMGVMDELSKPVNADYQKEVEELRSSPRFQKRYRGRAEDMRYEENLLRAERDRRWRALRDRLQPIDGNSYPAAVQNIFSVWEEKVETPWEKLQRLLTNFDWYYNYSDDFSVWVAGETRHKQIMALVEELGPDAREIYNQTCPWLSSQTQKGEDL